MRPKQVLEVQQHGLDILDLRRLNRDLPWSGELNRRPDEEHRDECAVSLGRGGIKHQRSAAKREDWDSDRVLDRLDPKYGAHLGSLRIGVCGVRIPEQKSDVVGAAAK